MSNKIIITAASHALLVRLVNDAPNWSGSPMLDIVSEERGNLTQLKRKKLCRTSVEEGVEFVHFTVGECVLSVDGKDYAFTVKKDSSYGTDSTLLAV